jgi:hypothetical protein
MEAEDYDNNGESSSEDDINQAEVYEAEEVIAGGNEAEAENKETSI